MNSFERPDFDSDVRKRIYAYVERHGIVAANDVAEHVQLPPEEVDQHVSVLTENGYLEESDGVLRVELDIGDAEVHRADDHTFTIRPAGQADLTGIVEVIQEVTAEGEYIVAENVAELLDYEEALLRHSTVESRVFFVATVDDEVVGWLHLTLPEFEKLRHTAELSLGVLEAHRGHGVGSRLLERGLQWASANGFRKAYNSLPASNRMAIQFLVAHGWNTEAIRKDHYRIDDEFVDEVMMAVRLA